MASERGELSVVGPPSIQSKHFVIDLRSMLAFLSFLALRCSSCLCSTLGLRPTRANAARRPLPCSSVLKGKSCSSVHVLWACEASIVNGHIWAPLNPMRRPRDAPLWVGTFPTLLSTPASPFSVGDDLESAIEREKRGENHGHASFDRHRKREKMH